jgi:DNA-binding NtrC family response regulator
MQCALMAEVVEQRPVALQSTILVIDDDRHFRSLVRTLLVRAGYEVLEAENGLEGLRLLEWAPIDLVITDMLMPGQEGAETIRRVRKLHPRLRILAMSGVDARHRYLRVAAYLGAFATLEKAVIPRRLLSTVGSALGC